MLKKWLGRILPNIRNHKIPQERCVHHRISLPLDNHAALKVLDVLHRAGFEAYLVGGAVRDMVCGIRPKDFDVATAATPEQVQKLFRRSRIIGRRFRIVHVYIGNEIIEVSTFRSGRKVRQNEHGRIMHDNTYGTVLQDALRRDFTCNALYYNHKTQEILDFHNGLEDIGQRRLVMIGNAAERYQEDPVRILRAVRLSGKLGFTADRATAEPISDNLHLLKKEPSARLFDEIVKILFSGAALGCLKQFDTLGIRKGVHPLLDAVRRAASDTENGIAAIALAQTDRRLQQGKHVSMAFVLAALFWQDLEELWQQNQERGMRIPAAMNAAVARLRDRLEQDWGISQRYSAAMREIWHLQPQFLFRQGSRPFRLLAQPRFRAAYDFLLLRTQAGKVEQEIADWWTVFQHADAETKEQMVRAQADSQTAEKKSKHRRSRRRKKTAEVQ